MVSNAYVRPLPADDQIRSYTEFHMQNSYWASKQPGLDLFTTPNMVSIQLSRWSELKSDDHAERLSDFDFDIARPSAAG